MTDIVINRCPRAKWISDAGLAEYARQKNVAAESVKPEDIDRSDPILVAMMRDKPMVYGGACSHITVVTVADDFKWKVMRKGNFEWVAADAS